jgi:hypothetical protein
MPKPQFPVNPIAGIQAIFIADQTHRDISRRTKDDHGVRRNHLRSGDGDRINAALAVASFNFRPATATVEALITCPAADTARALLTPRFA